MSSSKTFFIKAQKYHNKGEIKKSLEYCEKAISQDIKNAAALNLKGLLHYYLGDINTAKAVWRTNKDINNDGASKTYLSNLNNEEELLDTYIRANKLIEQYKVNEARELLERCNKSSFNTINVSCSLAKCYIYSGENDKAAKYLKKIFDLDKNNEFAKEINKSMINSGGKSWHTILIYSFIIIVVAAIVTYSTSIIMTYYKEHQKSVVINDKQDNNTVEQKENSVNNEEVKKEESNVVEKEDFPSADFKQSVNDKDYNKLFDLNEKWKNKDKSILNESDKVLLIKAEEILIRDAVPVFYNEGLGYFRQKNNEKAIEVLNKALIYSKGSYLREHILYFLSSSYMNHGDTEKAISSSEEYINLYDNKAYSAQVLYNLTLLYKNIDKEKAKKYANILATKYKNSEYNNKIVKEIVNN